MDPMYSALSLFRRRKFDKCVEVCTEILEKQPLDQAAWCLKMRSLTQRVYVDDLESEDMVQDDFLEDNAVASAPRPGTSLKTAATAAISSSAVGTRPRTSTGRPLSGVIRPGTQSGRPTTSSDRLIRTARARTTQSSRAIRLGTAAMLSQKDGPFIQISRLNLAKYANIQSLNKPLFEYLFYHEGDIKNATELAVLSTQACEFKDWWWKIQLGKCYVALNMVRDAEQQIRSAVRQHHHIENFIRLIRIYVRLDQPLSAKDVCKGGLEIFPKDVSIMTEMARLHESLGEHKVSVKFYRSIVIEDAMNTEAIACIGMHHFYNNQPEMALKYYRRVMALGAYSAELYNNLALCCLYSQQLDLIWPLFQRALELATEQMIRAEIWYNVSYLALTSNDVPLAIRCLTISLNCDSYHAPSLNNLAVLYYKTGKFNLAKVYLTSAKEHQPTLWEPEKNLEILNHKN